MPKEQQYMIAMIVLAGLCGALIISFIVACCCCMRYQRKLMGGGSGTRFGKHTIPTKVVEEVQWPVTSCDAWGATPYGSTNPYGGSQDSSHESQKGYASAYDWALPNRVPGATNPYAAKTHQCGSNDYGRVLLNPPSAVCSKAAMPSSKLGGQCGGGGCDGKFYQASGQPLSSTAAQFVLDSGANRHY